MYRKALSIRRVDGQVKQCDVKCKDSGRTSRTTSCQTYAKKSSRDVFVPIKVVRDFIDGTQSLVVCEKQNVSLDEPFTRRLPSCFAHDLFFGDLIVCYHDDQGIQRDLLVDDFVQVNAGTHPLWCLINASSDVGEKKDDHDEDGLDDEDSEDDESSEGENEDDEEDDIPTDMDEENDMSD